MALKIERKKDQRVIKALLHRIADIPGGVTVCTAELGGKSLIEGTPMGFGNDGMYHVCKTAQIVTDALIGAKTYEITKSHHFKAGDSICVAGVDAFSIEKIDKSNPEKDIITVTDSLGALKVGDIIFQTKGEGEETPLYTALALVGSSYDVEERDNLFVDAWLIAVVRRGNAPVVCKPIEDTLKGIHYIS